MELTALNKASCELWIATIRGAMQKNDGIPESPMVMLRKVLSLRETRSPPDVGALSKSESWASSASTVAVEVEADSFGKSESSKQQKPFVLLDSTSLRSRSVRSYSNATESCISDSGTVLNRNNSTATSSSKNRPSSLPLSPEPSPPHTKSRPQRARTDDTTETAVNEPVAHTKKPLDNFKMTPGMQITKAEYDELNAAYAIKVAECRDMYQCLSVLSTKPVLIRHAEAQTSGELEDNSWDNSLSIINGYF